MRPSLSGDADIIRMTAPEDYAYNFQGRARELLTKAESAARACGVPVHLGQHRERFTVHGDHRDCLPAGCDLIFMASHGRRSTRWDDARLADAEGPDQFGNSGAGVGDRRSPVLAQAIAIIRDEHRSLAAVLHAWQHLFWRRHRQGDAAPTPA